MLNLFEVLHLPKTPIPFWKLKSPSFHMISNGKKASAISFDFKHEFYEYLSHVPKTAIICYTDGSKNDNRVGSAFKYSNLVSNAKLNDISSSFTAEACAMEMCLQHSIKTYLSSPFREIIIFTDSKSLIMSMQQTFPKNSIVQNVQELSHVLLSLGAKLSVTWIPSHCGIPGNEEVDLAAKSISHNTVINHITMTDLKVHLKFLVKKIWQKWWDDSDPSYKIKLIKKDINAWESSNRNSRQEEKIITRLRIGHTLLTHQFLMENSNPPICPHCPDLLTIDHILRMCPKYENLRVKYNYINKELVDMLGDSSPKIDKLMKFLKETHVYKKI